MGNLYTSTTFMEHNSHPDYKYEMDTPTHEHEGINPSCGDELTLQLRVENGVIEDRPHLPVTAAPSARPAPISWPTSSPERRSRRLVVWQGSSWR